MTTGSWTLAVLLGLFVYTALAVHVYRRHKQPGLAAVMFMAAFWTVLGAFAVITAKGGTPSAAFSYLESRTYPVLLNEAYAQTLAIYFAFLIIFLAILTLVKPWPTRDRVATVTAVREVLSYFPLILAVLVAMAGLALQFLIVQQLTGTIGTTSLYDAASNTSIPRAVLRLNNYLNLATSAVISVTTVAIVVRASKQGLRPNSILGIATAIAMIGAQYRINVVLGTRSATLILALSIIIGLAAYGWGLVQGSVSKRTRWILGILGLVALYLIGAIGLARTNSNYGAQSQSSIVSYLFNPAAILEELSGAGAEGELLPAHFSLYHVFNSGLNVGGLIPYWDSTYRAYASQLLLPADQGFTIHLVAGWWLVAGVLAPLLAALQLGGLIYLLLWIARRNLTLWSACWIFVATTWAMASVPVTSLRSGPEGLRGTLTAALLVPFVSTVVLWLIAFKRWQRASRVEPEVERASTRRADKSPAPVPTGQRSDS